MTTSSLLDPGRVDEPLKAEQYADVLSRVAADGKPIIVRREGADLAAVVSLEHLERLYDLMAREEAERIAERIDWDKLAATSPPPQDWFDRDEPKPF